MNSELKKSLPDTDWSSLADAQLHSALLAETVRGETKDCMIYGIVGELFYPASGVPNKVSVFLEIICAVLYNMARGVDTATRPEGLEISRFSGRGGFLPAETPYFCKSVIFVKCKFYENRKGIYGSQ